MYYIEITNRIQSKKTSMSGKGLQTKSAKRDRETKKIGKDDKRIVQFTPQKNVKIKDETEI